MAYNPAMYQTYGNMYGSNYGQYQQPMAQSYMPQQSTVPAQGTQAPTGIIWVDGEVGAKAYQMPSGWQVNTPIPLWDTNDTVIYLKSTNPMGMPNPLQKIHYKMEESQPKYMGQSGTANLMSGEEKDMSDYVKKDDLERMKEEITKTITESISQSGATRRTAKEG